MIDDQARSDTRLLTRRDAENHLTRVGFQPAQPADGPLLPFVYAAHVPLIDSAGRPTADTPQMRRALTWYHIPRCTRSRLPHSRTP